MTALNRKVSALRTAEPIQDKWWLTLVLPYLVVALQLLAFTMVDHSWGGYAWLLRILAVAFFATLALAILGLYFDIIYVANVSEWKPSMWYSLMFFTPVVGPLICLHYLYRRSKYVG